MRGADCTGAVSDESDAMQVVDTDTLSGGAVQPSYPGSEAHG